MDIWKYVTSRIKSYNDCLDVYNDMTRYGLSFEESLTKRHINYEQQTNS